MEKLTLKEFEQEMRAQPDCEEYTAHSGKRCLRTFGLWAWYLMKCDQLGIEPQHRDGLAYEAKGNGFSLSWVEHDVILAFDA